jgi:hypothetical protein
MCAYLKVLMAWYQYVNRTFDDNYNKFDIVEIQRLLNEENGDDESG